MVTVKNKFKSGDVIFKDGESGGDAYLLVSGAVEILHSTPEGVMRLKVISPGDIFGELDGNEDSRRNVTARALENVLVEIIDQSKLPISSLTLPEVASEIQKVTSGIQNTNHLLSSSSSLKIFGNNKFDLGLWGLIGELIAKRRNKRKVLDVSIVPLTEDVDQANTLLLSNILSEEPEIRVRIVQDGFPENTGGSEVIPSSLIASLGRKLLIDEDADLLIWGEVEPVSKSLSLRFVSRKMGDDRSGEFLPTDLLPVPANYSPEYKKLLFVSVLAATEPREENTKLMMRPLLINAIKEAEDAVKNPSTLLSNTELSQLRVIYGNTLATLGNYLSNINWYHQAIEFYQDAIGSISEEITPAGWANANFQYGRTAHILGDKCRNTEYLLKALESYKVAQNFFSRSEYPWEWCILQNRVGAANYRLDTLNTDDEYLKAAVSAYHAALKVINRKSAPLKWGEIKNNLGQALQVWGDRLGSQELMELAIKCCEEALLVRSKKDTPLLWATTKNNLGSALFLSGRRIKSLSVLQDSSGAFKDALAIYRLYGVNRLGDVTERNMQKSEELCSKLRANAAPKLDWEEGNHLVASGDKLNDDSNVIK